MTSTQILVVEDETIVAKDIQNMLKSLGYEVPVVVFNGEEAVKKAAENRPDLVLMDIRLKGNIDGVEAAKKIYGRFNIPVIYLTAYGDEKTLERAKTTKPYGYILKPFEERDLHTNIEIGLYRHKMEGDLWIKNSAIAPSINAIAITDINGDFTYVNNSFLKMWGYEKDKEILGKNMAKLWRKRNKNVNVLDKVVENGRWMGERIAERKDGSLFDVQISANMVADDTDNPICIMTSFMDITKRKEAEKILKKSHHELESRVEKRTIELAKTNEKLHNEITKCKKMEGKVGEIKEYLQNIINSTPEIIITFDMNNHVTTWNNSVENVTSYKQSQIFGRNITKLDVFDNPQEVLKNLTNFTYKKKERSIEIILKTKDNDKRTVKGFLSPIRNSNNQIIGILFMGEDITHKSIVHKKLLAGDSYLITDKNNKSALNLFKDLIDSGNKGLIITRGSPKIIRSMIPSKDTQVLLLNQHKLGGFENIKDLKDLIVAIKEFSMKNANSIILLDRVDYLITNFSFEEFAKSLYQINSIISENKAILLFRIDPFVVDRKQMAIIENELSLLTSQESEEIKIDEELHNILKFIYGQNQNNLIVAFKDIGKEFSLVNKTVANKLRMIENKDLIFVKKQGRIKSVHISEKGKTLLNNR